MFNLFNKKVENSKMEEDERIKGALFGFFVGDSLGVPVEFVARDELRKHKVTKMLEYGTHGQPVGTWSDDSSMVLATMDSIIHKRCIDYYDIMDNFLKWYKKGEYTPNGEVFDIGFATAAALSKYKNDGTNFACGSRDISSNGNGSLMRILPVSLYLHYNDDPMYDVISRVSSMTHAHSYSIFSCVIYTVFINEYLKYQDMKKAYSNVQEIMKDVLEHYQDEILEDAEDLKKIFNRLIYNDISILKETEIKSSGFVIDSLEACFWCLLNTDNYKDAVLKAVNLGDDTDTVAALTGGLAGMVYGYRSIPEKWINVLQKKEYLVDLVNQFDSFIIDLRTNKAIYMWSNGLGDMRKYVNGENPLPKKDKKATADSWKCKPFSSSQKIDCNIVLTPNEFATLSMGHIPEVMEDHWFMFCDDNSINYFRSWTGIQIFKGHYKLENGSCVIYALEINDNKEEYNEDDIHQSLRLFNELITTECKMYK